VYVSVLTVFECNDLVQKQNSLFCGYPRGV